MLNIGCRNPNRGPVSNFVRGPLLSIKIFYWVLDFLYFLDLQKKKTTKPGKNNKKHSKFELKLIFWTIKLLIRIAKTAEMSSPERVS